MITYNSLIYVSVEILMIVTSIILYVSIVKDIDIVRMCIY